jgi:hypothetical protein
VTSDILFGDVRSDWYAANTLLPRLVVRSVLGGPSIRLIRFPTVWIPVCVHYGIEFDEPQPPQKHVPMFSDMPASEISRIAIEAKRRGQSRALLESTAALDPVIADLIYIVDHKLASAGASDPGCDGVNLLNTSHSFDRPEVIRLQEQMCRHVVQGDLFVMLPCSRHRPYGESRTHTRLARQLRDVAPGCAESAERVVVTSLGVVPETFWREPLVMSYDAGAVDLWRVFQLLRMFFTVNKATSVIDCLSFKPYSDMLRLLQELGTFHCLSRPLRVRWRSFHVTVR